MALEWLGPVLACVLPLCVGAERPEVFFQAHRGGMNEVPENTLAAFDHAWAIILVTPLLNILVTPLLRCNELRFFSRLPAEKPRWTKCVR
jgi:uncharacterized protein involved in cysteine biosynthesis